MATVYGNTVNSRWRAYYNYSTSSNNTQTTLTAEACIQVNAYSVQYNGVSAGVSIDNTVNKSAKKGITKNYSAGTTYYSYASASKTFTRGKSAATKYFSSWATFGPGSSSWQGTSNAYGSISVPAKPSYTVSYNANGGSGAPGNQTKWYGETLTLSSTKPARTGYSFQGWATSSGGSVAYASGASYTGNAALTLYAVWKANTYAVTYNANGGSGAPGQQTKTYGVTLKLSSTKPTRTNYNFKGWATSATGAVAYQPGANYTNNAAVTLYAVWKIAYIAPRITNVTADRCNSAGIYSEDGTYAKVTFNWATDEAVSSVKILCNDVTTTVSGQSGTSGSVSQVVGAGALITESEYSIVIAVVDAKGQSTYTTSVAPLAYIMDYSPQGGVGIGTIAPDSKELNIAIPSRIENVIKGFEGNGYIDHWQYKILARGAHTNSDTSSIGHIRVFGSLGGWTSGSKGPIDMSIPTRGGSNTTITINSFAPVLFNNSAGRLIARLGNDGYVYLILAVYQYYSYNLLIEGVDITILDSPWSTSISVAGTDWLNTANVLATQFGGFPLKTEKLNGFYGIALPDKTRNDWFRTTYSGLIPYQSGTPSPSALGTSTWVFKDGWMNGLNWTGNGLRGRVMKLLWSGTWSSGSITISELPYYNLFLVRLESAADDSMLFCSRQSPGGSTGEIEGSLVSKYVDVGFWMYVFRASLNSATSMSLSMCAYQNNKNTTTTHCAVAKIYGLL